MGMFLALSGVIGKTRDEVCTSLENYAKLMGGSLHKENLSIEDKGACVIAEANSNVSILYPGDYFEWDKSSEFISKELKAAVFSCHIHDSDLWMYVLYYDGKIVDQFNPLPDYWDADLTEEEINSWKGNAEEVAKYVPGLDPEKIKNYLVRWDFESIESLKAYPNDQFTNEDWQLLDFMAKLGLPYPVNENGEVSGQVYKLLATPAPWEGKPINFDILREPPKPEIQTKPWWKFW